MEQEINDYKQYIRRFSTYDILDYFSKISIDIYKNCYKGVKVIKDKPFYSKKTGMKMGTHTFIITQWELLEICFNAIKYGNDYRNNLITENEFYTLINKTKILSEKLENAKSFKNDDIFKHLICITNMEFDFENLNIQSKFNRLYHMMTIINQNKKYDQTNKVNYIDFKKKFYEITDIEYDKYIKCYMIIVLLASSGKNTNIMEIIDSINFDITKLGFTKDDMKLIIQLQSKEYSFYKDKDNWNFLKYNPIVHSSRFKEKYIIANISALMISFSEFMYWTIRNYYCNIGSNDFTNYFGHCFEYYLNDFFEFYNIKHYKIPETNDKVPDWKVETNDYIFLIEQKSALYPLNTRSITSDDRIKVLDKYISDNIKNAFVQLNNYDINSTKTIIRICLMLEDINIPDTVQDIVLKEIKNKKGHDYLNWIVSIDDFEKLFSMLSRNEKKFNDLIENKIKLEKSKSNKGRGFDILLSSYKNEYITNKINYFKQILSNEITILENK